jgi:hypothetical protein
MCGYGGAVTGNSGTARGARRCAEGGFYLAGATGGFVIPETNDVGSSLRRIYSDLSGYYVLAFRPPDDSFERDPNGELKYHRIRVRVNRPGFEARTRAGFLGEAASAGATRRRAKLRLEDSLESPFGASDIGMEMHATYLRAKANEPLIHVSVNSESLSLSGPAINRSAIVHLLLRAYDVHGAALDGGIDRFPRVSLNQAGYNRAMKYGLVYSTTISARKPGPYEVRAAVLDEASGALGSANELVVVPKAASRDLSVSGILFHSEMACQGGRYHARAGGEFISPRREFALCRGARIFESTELQDAGGTFPGRGSAQRAAGLPRRTNREGAHRRTAAQVSSDGAR